MGIRFVTPEKVRLPLSDNEFIFVKSQLTHGEHDDMMGQLGTMTAGASSMQVNTIEARTVRVLAYLLGWSSPEPIDRDTLRNLDEDSFSEIEAAIDAHLARVDAGKKTVTAVPSATTYASVGS